MFRPNPSFLGAKRTHDRVSRSSSSRRGGRGVVDGGGGGAGVARGHLGGGFITGGLEEVRGGSAFVN
jgi:hypothetical protein